MSFLSVCCLPGTLGQAKPVLVCVNWRWGGPDLQPSLISFISRGWGLNRVAVAESWEKLQTELPQWCLVPHTVAGRGKEGAWALQWGKQKVPRILPTSCSMCISPWTPCFRCSELWLWGQELLRILVSYRNFRCGGCPNPWRMSKWGQSWGVILYR